MPSSTVRTIHPAVRWMPVRLRNRQVSNGGIIEVANEHKCERCERNMQQTRTTDEAIGMNTRNERATGTLVCVRARLRVLLPISEIDFTQGTNIIRKYTHAMC
jgi:hypothetical protein